MGEMSRSIGEFQAWLQASPPGTMVDARVVAQALSAVPPTAGPSPAEEAASWRVRLWVVPPDTRLGVAELLEALGRTRSWLYRHTGPRSPGVRIPHRKLEGELVFLAGEIRSWVVENEEVVVPARGAALVVTRRRRPG